MNSALKLFYTLITAVLLLELSSSLAFAQINGQIAYSIELNDPSATAGKIVSQNNGVYSLSTKEYDPGKYGVIVNDPAVSLNQITSTTKYVVSSGQAKVTVSRKNGDIKEGDLITTSKDKGIGQKATKSGHVLGKALKSFPNDTDKGETGSIPVLININYNQVSAQSEALTQTGLDQVTKKVSSALVSGNLPSLLKYIFALLLGLISFFVGLYHFVKSNRTAVESIARNPMAKSDIQKQLVIGTAGIVAVSGVGLAIGIWILFFL